MKENKIETWEPDGLSPIFIEDIKDVLQSLYNQFRAVSIRNEYLEKDNAYLKSESYKDEEIAKIKKEWNEMREDYNRGFPISEEEHERINKWVESRPIANEGAIGGRYSYEFTPTSIGTIGTIVDSFTGEKFTFQDI